MNKKLLIIIGVVVLLILAYVFDVGSLLSLENVKAQQAKIDALYQAKPLLFIGAFFLTYVAVAALSIPGAAILTLLSGAIFGLFLGLLIASFASTIGATLAFLASRYLLRTTVENKFSNKLQAINRNVEKEGAFYLFTMRLVPIFPFFLVNLVMGLTKIKTTVFYGVSQIGMLLGTAVFVNAGTQLANIESVGEILSPKLILSFALLGIFPIIAKKIVDFIKAKKVYENFDKPEKFDRDIVVLGAGSGGLVTAYIGAAVKSKVSLIEKHKMGGDCLNTGCVPSKALIKSGKIKYSIDHAEKYGVMNASGDVDFKIAMQRVHEVVAKIEPHDSPERYRDLGVDVIEGEGRIIDPWRVAVNGQTLTTRNIVVATGARPFVPPIPGIEDVDYLTSDNLWDIEELPEKLVVLGGGPIGCELTQAFKRLGSDVYQIEMASAIMGREDPEVAEMVKAQFEANGIHVMVNTKAVGFKKVNGRDVMIAEQGDATVEIDFDKIIVAVGRKARVTGFGLEELNIGLNKNGTIEHNEFLQTDIPNIYAVGDVAGPYQFTHVAAHQAWFAAVNSLFGHLKKFRADYRVIPWATFTDPEVARVGLNETDAKEEGTAYEVTKYGIDDLDRAIADGTDSGFIKVLTVPGKDKILGVTIVGEHAGDLIAEYVLAMKHGLGLNKILGTIHIYPTLAEANKYVAGEWKRAHQPETVLKWLKKFHAWRRGDNKTIATTEADSTSS